MGSDAGGFNFDLVKRNAVLGLKGMKAPKAWSTGTTICGVVYKVRILCLIQSYTSLIALSDRPSYVARSHERRALYLAGWCRARG